MITISMLPFIISSFCHFSSPGISKETKIVCMEFMVNCAIVKDGQTSSKLVDACKEKWSKKND